MNSGKMSFQAVLIHCPSSTSDSPVLLAGVSGQFLDSSHFLYSWHSWSLNGLLASISVTSKPELMSPDMTTRSVFTIWSFHLFQFNDPSAILTPASFFSLKEHLVFCPRHLSAIQSWVLLSSPFPIIFKNNSTRNFLFQKILSLQNKK